MSYRTKLQLSLFLLGLVVIASLAWQASTIATTALRRATSAHLTAVRETKRHLIEAYVRDLTGHARALSSDESSVTALERFREAWDSLGQLHDGDPGNDRLALYYRDSFAPRVASQLPAARAESDWFPRDARVRALQRLYIADNPHPTGQKDLLLAADSTDAYSDVHARYHPTLHRYQSVFGFYDIFLIDIRRGRILYSVSKEIDLGQELTAPPFQGTALGRAFEQAAAASTADVAVIEDYAPYPASYFAPAAFVAAPIWKAGAKIGVLAIQVPIERVNRVMTSDRDWRDEGLGDTGYTYIVARDGTLRSDVRPEIEDSERFFSAVAAAGVDRATIDRIRENGTAILNLSLPAGVMERLHTTPQGETVDRDLRGLEVVRSHTRLNLPGLDWYLVAEMQTAEAFGPVALLLRRLLLVGTVVALAFLAAAWWLARSVTRPVLALANGTRQLAERDFRVRLPVSSSDEIGGLAHSFNQMAERLEQTTVSRDDLDRANQQLIAQQLELRALTARLIRAQEDERGRLARELHDDLTQRLAAAAIAIGTLSRPGGIADERSREELRRVHGVLAEIARDVHGLSRRLHPAMLDDLGLAAAVETECRSFFERGGAPVSLSCEGPLEGLGRDTRLALYRILQEALRNILTHADASEVLVALRVTDAAVTLEIADNGKGFDRQSSEWQPGLGLASMSERARLLGGSAIVDTVRGGGTRLTVRLPREAAQ